MLEKQKYNIIWFRNDLRVFDNYSIKKAFQENLPIIAVYCFDPRHYQTNKFGFKKTEKFRAQFLIESVENLQKNLKEKLNISLLIFNDYPEKVLPNLHEEYFIEKLFLQKEWTQEEVKVQQKIQHQLPEVKFIETYDQFLFHPEDIPYDSFQHIPKVYTQFRKKLEAQAQVRPLANLPEPQPENFLINHTTKVPSLKGLGLAKIEKDSRTAFPFCGGEDEANKRIQYYFWETGLLQHYKKTRNQLLGADYSSKLSAWLANGSISARTIYWQVKKFENQVVKNDSTYWLIFELIWRDYFKYISLKHGNKIFQLSGILDKNLTWNNDQEAFKNWIKGNTKEPFVNANMKEIAATGFMSNRGRQNVNSFWAKELKQDWRVGAVYLESMLIDYDVHSNWGNWMYNSGVGNDPRDRKFNIASQAKRYDPEKKYQQTWLSGQKELF
ncbi:DASH family cryptochrome [Mesonia aestuariivivens]|uniref:Cryptochrome DASH n=1 Tax=Mesonia aestuariivivens TaxID=2796128 RepID=A0ABS6VZ81_9FLAO|nr:DASH family cryptochrome [Mesonia aestuariivivens]MBW2960903.1 DASH family cryptochrome [Mesonia aestuariivivens]